MPSEIKFKQSLFETNLNTKNHKKCLKLALIVIRYNVKHQNSSAIPKATPTVIKYYLPTSHYKIPE